MDVPRIDGLAWVRERPTQFFSSGRIEAVHLLLYVVNDLLELGGGDCRVASRGGWWFVASNTDWLVHPQHSVSYLFAHVVPAPLHGDHSLRAEVLMSAFCSDVTTWTPMGEYVVKGTPAPADLMAAAMDLSWAQRVIALRVTN